MGEIKAEVDHCRHRLMKYCQGQGLDLGCGPSKIKADAIGIDLYHHEADMCMDARVLTPYSNEQFDYIFSSHLLEEVQDTEGVLKEWLRVLKKGGNLVLYQISEKEYYPIGDPRCNGRHKNHYTWEGLLEILKRIGGVELVHHAGPVNKEWSFELVVQKNGNKLIEGEPEGISILVPTLNRPDSIEAFASAVDKMTSIHNVEIVYGVHDFDKGSRDRVEAIKANYKISVRCEIIDQFNDGKPHLSFLWNQLYTKAKYPILGFFGDDVVFRTPGWDVEVRKEFLVDKSVMVSCNDVHVQHIRGKQATLFFTHKTVHEKIGFYMHPEFRRWYMDTFWDSVYRGAGKMHYREDIVTEHFHPVAFPEKADDVFKRMECLINNDKIIWASQAIQELIRQSIDKMIG